MPRGPEPIGDVLAQLIARKGFAGNMAAAASEAAWKEAAGELAARYSRVGPIRRGKLEVTVANSAWLQELTFQRQSLLKALTDLLPDQNIRELRFRIGSIGP